jgi:MYXO-CTERM domain-containing protein
MKKCSVLLSLPVLLLASSAGAQSLSPWEMHQGEGLVSFGFLSPSFGDPSEYQFATIPPAEDPGWGAAPNSDTIGFGGVSTLCGRIACRYGGEFTYFQTFVNIPANIAVSTFTISFSGIDDGVRVSIFNSDYPAGVVVPGSFVFLGGSGTADLAALVRSGEVNRVVVTHVDDCCSGTSLASAAVVLNGKEVCIDDDGDGVCDHVDQCPGTEAPETNVPSERLLVNHWVLGEDGEFVTVNPNGRGPRRSYTIEDTGGCNCEQIIEALDLGEGHRKHGCSISAMDDWSAIVAGGGGISAAEPFVGKSLSSAEIAGDAAGCQSTDGSTAWWFGAGLLLSLAFARRRARHQA